MTLTRILCCEKSAPKHHRADIQCYPNVNKIQVNKRRVVVFTVRESRYRTNYNESQLIWQVFFVNLLSRVHHSDNKHENISRPWQNPNAELHQYFHMKIKWRSAPLNTPLSLFKDGHGTLLNSLLSPTQKTSPNWKFPSEEKRDARQLLPPGFCWSIRWNRQQVRKEGHISNAGRAKGEMRQPKQS